MRLAIMLSSGPFAADLRTVRQLALAARRQGHEATVFLNAEGVLCAPALLDLPPLGVDVAACTASARQLGAARPEQVRWGSQLDWAEAVQAADRVIALG